MMIMLLFKQTPQKKAKLRKNTEVQTETSGDIWHFTLYVGNTLVEDTEKNCKTTQTVSTGIIK